MKQKTRYQCYNESGVVARGTPFSVWLAEKIQGWASARGHKQPAGFNRFEWQSSLLFSYGADFDAWLNQNYKEST